MGTTLPRARGTFLAIVVGTTLICCRHVGDPAVAPGPPIPAEPDTQLESMDAECAGLIAALDTYGKCPNLDEGDRSWVQRTIEAAEQTFAAGKKANADEPSQKAIALNCHRAALSMHFATERCMAGPRPKQD